MLVPTGLANWGVLNTLNNSARKEGMPNIADGDVEKIALDCRSRNRRDLERAVGRDLNFAFKVDYVLVCFGS